MIKTIFAICAATALLISAPSSSGAQGAVRGVRSGRSQLAVRVPLSTGGMHAAAGQYALHLAPQIAEERRGVSGTNGAWSTQLVRAATDVPRLRVRTRDVAGDLESLTVSFVPHLSADAGALNIVWRRRPYSVDWTAQLPASRAPPARD